MKPFYAQTFKSLKPSSARSRCAARARAGAPACAPRAGAAAAPRCAPGARRHGTRQGRRTSRSPPAGARQRLDEHQELVGAALDRDGARRVPRQLARGQQRHDVAHALVHDGTQLRQLPERPVALQHEAKRARVCQVQESQRIVQRRLQRVRKAAECAPGQLPIEAEQRQCRVACVEGHLAARAGESQRVARQRLAAHAATQGTRALSLSGVRGHAGYAQDVCGEGSRA
jgi:hypothetical protein